MIVFIAILESGVLRDRDNTPYNRFQLSVLTETHAEGTSA
jgi:hypothetical protein